MSNSLHYYSLNLCLLIIRMTIDCLSMLLFIFHRSWCSAVLFPLGGDETSFPGGRLCVLCHCSLQSICQPCRWSALTSKDPSRTRLDTQGQCGGKVIRYGTMALPMRAGYQQTRSWSYSINSKINERGYDQRYAEGLQTFMNWMIVIHSFNNKNSWWMCMERWYSPFYAYK